MKKIIKKALSLLFTIVLVITMLPQGLGTASAEAAVTLKSPIVKSDPSNTILNQSTNTPLLKNTIWDCVYFGSYPQKEVIADEASYKSNRTISSIYYNKIHDVIVDSVLYGKLKAASSWDSKGDVVIDGSKYHRIRQSDANAVVNNEKTTTAKYDAKFYKWSDATSYHYFKYEAIKWRVLEVKNGQALLMTDEAIEEQLYNQTAVSTTWASSTLRQYLNSSFISRAFSSLEASAIQTSTLTNENGKGYYRGSDGITAIAYETNGGSTTQDKVFILSSNEFRNEAYGFLGPGFFDPNNTYDLAGGIGSYDPTKFCTTTTYVKAMGAYCEDTYWEDCGGNGGLGGCYYWLRTPGRLSNWATHVCRYGAEVPRGSIVTTPSRGVRPCVRINISNANAWTYAGTYSTFANGGSTPVEPQPHVHTAAAAVKENVIDATCTKEGSYDSVVYCSSCKEELSRSSVKIAKIAHKKAASVKENVIDATCTKEGSYDSVVYCSVCKEEVSRTSVKIAKIAHKKAAAVKENIIEATCIKEGSYDSVIYCSVCKEEVSRTSVKIPKAAHKEGAAVREHVINATCTKEGSYESVIYCSVCKKELSRTPQIIGTAEGHKWSEWNITKAATVLATGSKVRSCTACGAEETASINKLTATIKLSSTKKTLKKGKYFTLKITNLAKGDAVKSVTTSKKSVATVKKSKTNQYKITAKKKGSATITVTLKSGKKAICKVTVK